MKFITLNRGKSVHLVNKDNRRGFADNTFRAANTYCGKWASWAINDKVHDKAPHNNLCKVCKKAYLKTHIKEELFLEML